MKLLIFNYSKLFFIEIQDLWHKKYSLTNLSQKKIQIFCSDFFFFGSQKFSCREKHRDWILFPLNSVSWEDIPEEFLKSPHLNLARKDFKEANWVILSQLIPYQLRVGWVRESGQTRAPFSRNSWMSLSYNNKHNLPSIPLYVSSSSNFSHFSVAAATVSSSQPVTPPVHTGDPTKMREAYGYIWWKG